MRAAKFVRSSVLAFASLAVLASLAMATGGPPCTITGNESACAPTQICGPEGNYSYYWARPEGGVEFTRCITAIEEGGYILWVTDLATGLQGEPCFFKYHPDCTPPCDITGPDDFCFGTTVQLCGPDGAFTYEWSGPGGFSATTRCVTVGTAGDYTLTVHNGAASCTNKHSLVGKTCVINCPRTVGFWGAQCAQKNNGSTKFTKAQVTTIASCVDDHSAFFNWSNDFNSFCATVSTTDMNQRVQAKRQYAGLLANICTGELGLVANNGNQIKLSTGTIVTCGGVSQSIADLIVSVEQKLASLESKNINDQTVKDAYSAIITCLDDINNGRGIGPVCPELLTLSVTTSELTASDGRDGLVASDLGFRVFPNPFAGRAQMAYSVPAAGANVSLGVYDLSGRLVKKLSDGFQAGGDHSTSWDATDMSGARVRTGMYFIRGRIGERAVASQVMLLQ